ncbi:YceI family protein [Deinococcus sp.]|uniref:YceI family protein n=1 Tax=Deinococcus sp. TaxID=47478 RepID=UPI003B5B1BC5
MKTPTQRTFAALFTLGLLTQAAAQSASYASVSDPANEAKFNFRVTLIPVPGTVSEVKAKLKFDPAKLKALSGEVQVPLDNLKTGIGLRDKHAKNYLKADKFPVAIFTPKSLSNLTSLPVGKTVEGQVNGTFSIAGVSHDLSAPVTLQRDQSGKITVTTKFNVTLTQYDINIPGADADTDVQVSFAVTPQ